MPSKQRGSFSAVPTDRVSSSARHWQLCLQFLLHPRYLLGLSNYGVAEQYPADDDEDAGQRSPSPRQELR